MAIKVSSGKAKGRKCQNWTAEQISNLIDLPWGKDEQIAPREMGQSGTDVRLIGDAKDLFPWAVECKWCEAWNLPAWIRQAKSHLLKEEGLDWLLIFRGSRKPFLACLDADVFLDLVAADLRVDSWSFLVESGKKWRVWEVLLEAIVDADRHQDCSCAFFRREGEDTVVVLTADAFFHLLEAIPKKRKGRP